MNEIEGILGFDISGKVIKIDQKPYRITPILYNNVARNFSPGERVRVDFYRNGDVKSVVLVREREENIRAW